MEIKNRTKYDQLKKLIKGKIVSSDFPRDSRIPTEPELCEMFKVSRSTVREAVSSLVHEGLLAKFQGRGTYVTSRSAVREEQVVGLFMPTEGHLWGDFSKKMIQKIQSMGYYSLVYDTPLIGAPEVEEKKFEQLCKINFNALLIYGISTFPFEFLLKRKVPYEKLLFFYHCETPLAFPGAARVLCDFEAGSWLAVKHLLSLGHSNILLYLSDYQKEPYYFVHQYVAGCRRALREGGYGEPDKHLSICLRDRTSDGRNIANLLGVLSSPRRPTAVFTPLDYYARDVYTAAARLKLSVPDDLALVGYHNTPWCDKFDVPLSSVSTGESEFVRVIAKLFDDEAAHGHFGGETIYIKPKLVIRQSCGAKTRGGATKKQGIGSRG